MLGNEAILATPEHDIHRMKRGKVASFFSRSNLDRLESLLQNVLKNTFAVIDRKKGTGEPMSLRNAFRSYASDIVCGFCFPDGTGLLRLRIFLLVFIGGKMGLRICCLGFVICLLCERSSWRRRIFWCRFFLCRCSKVFNSWTWVLQIHFHFSFS